MCAAMSTDRFTLGVALVVLEWIGILAAVALIVRAGWI